MPQVRESLLKQGEELRQERRLTVTDCATRDFQRICDKHESRNPWRQMEAFVEAKELRENLARFHCLPPTQQEVIRNIVESAAFAI